MRQEGKGGRGWGPGHNVSNSTALAVGEELAGGSCSARKQHGARIAAPQVYILASVDNCRDYPLIPDNMKAIQITKYQHPSQLEM